MTKYYLVKCEEVPATALDERKVQKYFGSSILLQHSNAFESISTSILSATHFSWRNEFQRDCYYWNGMIVVAILEALLYCRSRWSYKRELNLWRRKSSAASVDVIRFASRTLSLVFSTLVTVFSVEIATWKNQGFTLLAWKYFVKIVHILRWCKIHWFHGFHVPNLGFVKYLFKKHSVEK